jgi:hypothetical protein
MERQVPDLKDEGFAGRSEGTNSEFRAQSSEIYF